MNKGKFIYKAILWLGRKESELRKTYAESSDVDAYYYKESKTYAYYNSTDGQIVSPIYDKSGNKSIIELKPYEIRWIKEK